MRVDIWNSEGKKHLNTLTLSIATPEFWALDGNLKSAREQGASGRELRSSYHVIFWLIGNQNQIFKHNQLIYVDLCWLNAIFFRIFNPLRNAICTLPHQALTSVRWATATSCRTLKRSTWFVPPATWPSIRHEASFFSVCESDIRRRRPYRSVRLGIHIYICRYMCIYI